MVKKFLVRVNGKEYVVEVEEVSSAQSSIHTQKLQETKQPIQMTQPVTQNMQQENQTKQLVEEKSVVQSSSPASESVKIHAPMSGVILKVLVNSGQKVEYGQKVVILEAMKMENDIVADRPGIVKRVLVKEGDTVDTGQVLVELE
ncbi:MAG: biotin/lipoyl-containing protein [Fervidobacterium sp.]